MSRALVVISRCLQILAFIAPYLIINALTRFKPGQSTASQRGWTMAWLVFGQAYGIVEKLIPHRILFFLGLAGSSKFKPTIIQQGLSWVSFVALYAAPAIGGMVTTGKMIREYGTCVVVG